jgi:hypothetical protein
MSVFFIVIVFCVFYNTSLNQILLHPVCTLLLCLILVRFTVAVSSLPSKLKEVLKLTGRATRTSCCTYNLSQMYCGKIIRL